MHEILTRLYETTFAEPPAAIVRVAADGSQRAYYRLTGGNGRRVIGARGPDPEENRAFLSFSRSFRAAGLPVPEIYAADEAAGAWLEEDLGDTTLFSALTAAREREPGEFPASMRPAYERVVRLLPRVQAEGARVADFDVAYPRPAFDRQSMHWDLNYFKYHFLKLAHIPFSEQRLENDFERLAAFLLDTDTSLFLYRDFQSRNIMLRQGGGEGEGEGAGEGEPWLIDYQGGRRGAPHYDIASLLYDAKAAIPDPVREHLLDTYMDALAAYMPVDRVTFRERFRGYVLIRIMQAMGAYGYRGFFERKTRFLESVPYAARNIARLLEAGLPVRLPEVEAVFRNIADAWADPEGPVRPLPGLTVHVGSFSFRRGYPSDNTGHGGGFVFDCRALPNPGRHVEFAYASGRDPEVVAFLEAQPETEAFWSGVQALIDAQVRTYRTRGFTDLTVSFGCTGGQHRSVYFAERLARHLRESHRDIGVRLVHRERDTWPPPPLLLPGAVATAAARAAAPASGEPDAGD
jgi:aminoglycoside/choline kinase family phosphotransferase